MLLQVNWHLNSYTFYTPTPLQCVNAWQISTILRHHVPRPPPWLNHDTSIHTPFTYITQTLLIPPPLQTHTHSPLSAARSSRERWAHCAHRWHSLGQCSPCWFPALHWAWWPRAWTGGLWFALCWVVEECCMVWPVQVTTLHSISSILQPPSALNPICVDSSSLPSISWLNSTHHMYGAWTLPYEGFKCE